MGAIIRTEYAYRTIGNIDLIMHCFHCDDRRQQAGSPPSPAIVFFFGGGWVKGTPKQFFPHAEHFAGKGFIACCAEYRIQRKHGTTPFDSMEDARSAIRWIRQNSALMGADPARVIAAGGSAGGHLAACAAILNRDDKQAIPDALLLFNPVVDTTERGYGAHLMNGREREASPAHHVAEGLPPTLIMHGTADRTVPFENAQRFANLMQQHGNICKLVAYEGQTHGFFNYRPEGNPYYDATLQQCERFLQDIGIAFGHASP